jgi:hypothetical protein
MERRLLASLLATASAIAACSGASTDQPAAPEAPSDEAEAGTATPPVPDPKPDAGSAADAAADDAAAPRRAIMVDATNPKRFDFTFTAKQADAAATQSLGTQGAYLDTRVAPAGKLVVYLHGASGAALASCANGEIADLLAAKGFHVFAPCYNSYFGVGNCGADIGGCRKEAFEGIDHSAVVDIAPPDAIEPRIVAALSYLAKQNPGGDWGYFLEGGKPYWPDIIIAGHSHGASSAGLIGTIRPTSRVVMLSGPLDSGQAWLKVPPVTPLDRFYGFTHAADPQHAGHLVSFQDMNLAGAPASVDGAAAPYGGSHRLQSSAAVANGHGSTTPGGSSPKAAGAYVYAPVWTTMFGR